MQTLYTSGTVFHVFLGEKLPTWKAAAEIVRKIAENYEMPYYTLSPTYSVCPDHGYITGEVYKCPTCGKTTEVYSRITGYYRPVQNWNVGKTEEFKERKEYVLETSHFHGSHVRSRQNTVVDHATRLMLFTTKTCPNCRTAKAALDKAGVSYEVVDAEENADLARKYHIMQAPTLVALCGEEAEIASGIAAVKAYIERAC